MLAYRSEKDARIIFNLLDGFWKGFRDRKYIFQKFKSRKHISRICIIDTEKHCSTMWVGCQSRRFNCLFLRETRQRILEHEISPYPEVVRGGEWELTTRPRERKLVVGQEQRQLVVGQEQRQLVVGQEQKAVGVDPRRGSQHQTPSREARGQDRVQWRRVSRCLIPVALWNFR